MLGTSRARLISHEALEVPIQFLGCLDTVGSLGVPNTGLLTPLRWTPRLIKHLQFRDTEVPSSKYPCFSYRQGRADLIPDVLKFRHGLALDERRRVFKPTLMHIGAESDQDVEQVWFSGSHSDLGRMNLDGTGLGNIVLRWMIKELSLAGVRFNDHLLSQHFSHYTTDISALSVDNRNEWIRADVRSTWNLFWKGGGMKRRVPGWYGEAGKKTNEMIHATVFPRECAIERGPIENLSLPGHTRQANPEGGFGWKKTGSWSSRGSWSSNDSRRSEGLDMSVVPEKQHSLQEACLGGYPVS